MTGLPRSDPPDRPGFRTVAGLDRLLLVAGRLPAGDHGPLHQHEGEEILHVRSGRLRVTVGDRIVDCGPGDVVAVPTGVPHGFDVLAEAVLEVVAEQRIGTLYRVRAEGGTTRLVEVHRPDMPWGRPPPPGTTWTTDEALAAILARLV